MNNKTDEKSRLCVKYDRYRRLRKIRMILAPFVLVIAVFFFYIGSMIFKMEAYQYKDVNPKDEYRQCIEEKFETVLPNDLVIEKVWGGTMGFSSSDRLIYLQVNYTPEQWEALGIGNFISESYEVAPGKTKGSKLSIYESECRELMDLLTEYGKTRGSIRKFKIIRYSVTAAIIAIGVFPLFTILCKRTRKRIAELSEDENFGTDANR